MGHRFPRGPMQSQGSHGTPCARSHRTRPATSLAGVVATQALRAGVIREPYTVLVPPSFTENKLANIATGNFCMVSPCMHATPRSPSSSCPPSYTRPLTLILSSPYPCPPPPLSSLRTLSPSPSPTYKPLAAKLRRALDRGCLREPRRWQGHAPRPAARQADEQAERASHRPGHSRAAASAHRSIHHW